ncbi:hypothetical protein [Sagittula salina]|uniref:PepSY domain-containing protein n=1 Tax=Sagittula salina TaxID=2820268 RepID=A0A940RZU7_9RHOB|nr:hypothetical protein [Sagittula salina]MBP0481367.1 hypothetical protein [Sagittula salina]
MAGRFPFPRLCAVALMLAGQGASAQSALDTVVDQLETQRYEEIEIRRTFLGRIRINATGQGRAREIVINPSTGAILRDYTSTDRPATDDSGTTPGRPEPRAKGDHRAVPPDLDDHPEPRDRDDRPDPDDRPDRDDRGAALAPPAGTPGA